MPLCICCNPRFGFVTPILSARSVKRSSPCSSFTLPRHLGLGCRAKHKHVGQESAQQEESSASLTVSSSSLLELLPGSVRRSLSNEFDTRILALLIPALGSVFLDPLMAVIDTGQSF